MPWGQKRPGEVQVVVCGGGGVGKSAITIQFVQNRLVTEWDPTIEDQYKKSCVVDAKEVYLNIVDTAGQEPYRAMRPTYMQAADGFLLVYDITSRYSFEEVSTFHQEILQVKDVDSFPPIVLVANKSDLEYERQVRTNEGRDLARRLGCRFIECSAYHRMNVDESFHLVVREIRNHKEGRSSTPSQQWNSQSANAQEFLVDGGNQPEDDDICCASCTIA